MVNKSNISRLQGAVRENSTLINKLIPLCVSPMMADVPGKVLTQLMCNMFRIEHHKHRLYSPKSCQELIAKKLGITEAKAYSLFFLDVSTKKSGTEIRAKDIIEFLGRLK